MILVGWGVRIIMSTSEESGLCFMLNKTLNCEQLNGRISRVIRSEDRFDSLVLRAETKVTILSNSIGFHVKVIYYVTLCYELVLTSCNSVLHGWHDNF